MRIDSHQHFWQFDPVRDAWIDDSMKVIKRDFLPQDLKPLLNDNKIDGCVAVQADQSEKETQFLLSLAKNNTFIKGVVGWVDLRNHKVKNMLGEYQSESLLKGIRHIVQAEPVEFMLGKEFQHGISLLEGYDLTYDILVFPKQLPAAIQLVKKFPNQKFVLDHIAKPLIKDQIIGDWEKDIKALASYDNVFCKVSGMVTEADWSNWQADNFTAYLDIVFDAFGTNRIMYGSDWPVCLLAAKYKEQIEIINSYISALSVNEKGNVMGANAVSFYNL